MKETRLTDCNSQVRFLWADYLHAFSNLIVTNTQQGAIWNPFCRSAECLLHDLPKVKNLVSG
jgi:hypothetical protein